MYLSIYQYLYNSLSSFHSLSFVLFILSFSTEKAPIKSLKYRVRVFSHTGTHAIHRGSPIIDLDTPRGTKLSYPPHLFPYSTSSSSSNGEKTRKATQMQGLCFSCVRGQQSVSIPGCLAHPLFTFVFVFEAVFEAPLLLDSEKQTQEACCPPEYDVYTNEAYRRQMLARTAEQMRGSYLHTVCLGWREFRPFSVAEEARKERISENDEDNSSDEAEKRRGL